jgi:phage repressor protein C with HTH and peptisase S24 domain
MELVDSNTLKDRLERALAHWNSQDDHKDRRSKLTASGLAKAVGCTESCVSNWRSGKVATLFAGDVFKAARYLKVRPEWLADGSGPMIRTDSGENHPHRTHPRFFDLDSVRAPVAWEWESCEDLPQGEYVMVPRLSVVMLKDTSRAELDFLSPFPMRQKRVRELKLSPKALAYVVVDSNDMAPRILPGDTVFIDRSKTDVEDGRVYVVMWSGKRYLRRLHNRPDGALLISSDADRSQDFTIDADRRDSVSIIGQMIYFEAGTAI